jgi:hypothetical protein
VFNAGKVYVLFLIKKELTFCCCLVSLFSVAAEKESGSGLLRSEAQQPEVHFRPEITQYVQTNKLKTGG